MHPALFMETLQVQAAHAELFARAFLALVATVAVLYLTRLLLAPLKRRAAASAASSSATCLPPSGLDTWLSMKNRTCFRAGLISAAPSLPSAAAAPAAVRISAVDAAEWPTLPWRS